MKKRKPSNIKAIRQKTTNVTNMAKSEIFPKKLLNNIGCAEERIKEFEFLWNKGVK